MSVRSRIRPLVAAAGLVAAVAGALVAAAPATATPALVQVCGSAPVGWARCFADVVASPSAGKKIEGLRPADIADAYALSGGSRGVVAIVDAYDNPNAEADLAVYRAKWGLPPCTTANGCFRKVNQDGAARPLPLADPGWGLEIALDLDAVSSACPACSLLLVEGRNPSVRNLGTAVNTAVRLGADVVSNSYGLDEFGGIGALAATYYDHPGVPIVASSGDYGFGAAAFPAVATTVIGVGGTTLTRTGDGWTEQAWQGAGSGCSAYVAKPAFQADTGDHCQMRMVADVSAVADPDTGLAVYDTFGTEQVTRTGWLPVGGTSLAAPLVAGMLARAGHTARYRGPAPLYAHADQFHDVVGGRNGFCGGDYLCSGRRGYDGPTGIGTPNGLGGL